jgi:hypothetical protein
LPFRGRLSAWSGLSRARFDGWFFCGGGLCLWAVEICGGCSAGRRTACWRLGDACGPSSFHSTRKLPLSKCYCIRSGSELYVCPLPLSTGRGHAAAGGCFRKVRLGGPAAAFNTSRHQCPRSRPF